MKNHKLSKLLLASVISSLTVPTFAQQLEEVVVTASKRAENLQDIPQAVTAFSSERLVELGIVETSDLMGAVPNIQVTSAYGRTQPNFSIRGISVANEFSAATASPVGVYVDEVYQSFRASHGQQLFDLESVEVLRGPQGTLYGRNTTGGAVNVNTIKPSLGEGASGFLNVRLGNYSYADFTGAVEATIIPDVLGVRLSGAVSEADGYVDNTLLGTDHPQTSSTAGRLSVLWRPSDKTDIHAKVYWAENDPRQDIAFGVGYLAGGANGTGVPLIASPDMESVASDTSGVYFTSSEGVSLTVEHEINDSWSFTGIFGYDEGEYQLSPFECDGSALDVCAIRYYSESESYNVDLRIDFTSERLRFIGGIYTGSDEIFTANEPDFFGFLQPLLSSAGVPDNYFNPSIAVGNSLSILPLFAAVPGLDPTDPANCAPLNINPNGFFDARSLIAFNTDVALLNSAGGTAVQAACAAAGAPPFANIDVSQEFTIERPSTAIYGEISFDVTDRLTTIVGLRYTQDDVKYKDAVSVVKNLGGTPVAALVPYIYDAANVAAGAPLDMSSIPRVNQDESTNELTGRFVAQYRMSDDVMLYGSYALGYRAGTYNALAYQDVSQVYFVEPETVDAFELGLKARLLDNTLQVNAAAFYYDYSGQQIAQIVGATSFLRSADGEVSGGEIELSWQASDNLLINASAGFLDTEYDDQQLSADGANIGGNEFPNAPQTSVNLNAQLRVWSGQSGDLTLSGEAQYMGDYWFDPFNDYGQQPCDRPASGASTLLASPELACQNPGYWLLNARVAYTTDKYTVAAWARNISDKGYYTYGLNLNAFYQDYLVRGMPRAYGVEFRMNF